MYNVIKSKKTNISCNKTGEVAELRILRGGCASRHEASFVLSRPYGQDNHVILLLRSKGEYWINDEHHLLEPGNAIIIAPNTHYMYYNPSGEYMDDWIHFKLEEGETLTDDLVCNVPFELDDMESCSMLIRQLLWEQAYTSPLYADRNISALLSVLLNHLSAAYHSQESIEKASPYLQKLKQLRLQMQSTPSQNHSINKYAAELSISPSHFQHLYSQLFGISFQNDLIRMRIAYAEILLHTTDLPVERVAEACGYTNSVHFFRQFKQMKGITPAKCRKTRPSTDI